MWGGGESGSRGVAGELVAEAARDRGHRQVVFHPDKETLAESLVDLSRPGDLVVTLGAGDIYRVGEKFLELLGRAKE